MIFEFPVCQAWMLQVCGLVANGEKIGAPLYEEAEQSAALEADLEKLARRLKRKTKTARRR